ncbi:cupin domain-containing protein [Agromyces salentinus]|uniref:Cupin domain-containing protein n=1 Tax=Agromyces salentinus TaxID=269421 RepID=A0ABN2MIR7_9MICO|nr:cupin domain-containing protein [Agromyces salentinus]
MTASADPTRLLAGAVTDAASLALEHEPVPADQVVAGSPTTGYVVLDARGPGADDVDPVGSAREIGVWEMTPGAMRDVEADEVFVVLAGDATVEFERPALESIVLRPGSIVRLDAGMETVWTVRETLRKVFVAP